MHSIHGNKETSLIHFEIHLKDLLRTTNIKIVTANIEAATECIPTKQRIKSDNMKKASLLNKENKANAKTTKFQKEVIYTKKYKYNTTKAK